jgi:AcrR family transcriptional regulator
MDISVAMAPDTLEEPVRRRIVHTALVLAERARSWDAVHVHAVAREAGITLDELRRHFGDKDQIAEGFFDWADDALLASAQQVGWTELPVRERLFRAIMAWLDALSPHRRLVAGMLGYKLHPEHIHLQVRGIMRISRTVQWIREAALPSSAGWRRELEEAALTSIYLATFARWLTDRSPGAQATRRLLKGLLDTASRGVLPV